MTFLIRVFTDSLTSDGEISDTILNKNCIHHYAREGNKKSTSIIICLGNEIKVNIGKKELEEIINKSEKCSNCIFLTGYEIKEKPSEDILCIRPTLIEYIKEDTRGGFNSHIKFTNNLQFKIKETIDEIWNKFYPSENYK